MTIGCLFGFHKGKGAEVFRDVTENVHPLAEAYFPVRKVTATVVCLNCGKDLPPHTWFVPMVDPLGMK